MTISLSSVLLVGLGGAVGAMIRFAVSAWVGVTHLFPWATLSINIAGSLAIGLVWGMWGNAEWFNQWGRLLIVVGVLGGFTTFSAFSLETLTLLQNERWLPALAYSFGSIGLCLLAVFLGERMTG